MRPHPEYPAYVSSRKSQTPSLSWHFCLIDIKSKNSRPPPDVVGLSWLQQAPRGFSFYIEEHYKPARAFQSPLEPARACQIWRESQKKLFLVEIKSQKQRGFISPLEPPRAFQSRLELSKEAASPLFFSKSFYPDSLQE